MSVFYKGDHVYKVDGYRFVGYIVGVVDKLDGDKRYVVENADGMLHIFNAKQLAHMQTAAVADEPQHEHLKGNDDANPTDGT